MSASSIAFSPLTGHVGAEVSGVDLAAGLDDAEVAAIDAALARHGVLVFHGQQLTPEQHIALAGRFGPIVINRFFAALPGHEQIALVLKEPEQTRNLGARWHTDHSYDEAPALGSLLYAREVPRVGGDTLFASMYAACEALSPGLRRTLEGLRAVHSSRHVFGPEALRERNMAGRLGNAEAATQDSVHPVIIQHPVSGRAALYVNLNFTTHFEGWSVEESRPLLELLERHATRPEFVCRVRWQVGTLVFWDNRCTWHKALNDYHGERRLMHRITVAGTPLAAYRSVAEAA